MLSRIIIENWSDPGGPASSSWQRAVRKALIHACRESDTPGFREEDTVSVFFGSCYIPGGEANENPEVATILFEGPYLGLQARKDFAIVLGRALLGHLPVGWRVDALPRLYDRREAGATLINADGTSVES